jgi:hypothetical protein
MGMTKKNFSMRIEVATSPRKKMAIIGRMARGRGGGEIGELPEEGALDQAADGDEELVAEVELPVAVEEAAEAEDVGLHGGDYDDFGWAVRGLVSEKEEGVAEGGDEGEDGGDSQGRAGFM